MYNEVSDSSSLLIIVVLVVLIFVVVILVVIVVDVEVQLPPLSQVLEELGEAAKDEETTVTTITGAGQEFRLT